MWKNRKAELIDAELANAKCPEVVIRFLNKRISWIDKGTDDFSQTLIF